LDAIALMDGLGIEKFAVVSHDWGSHVAECLSDGPTASTASHSFHQRPEWED
jgi:hypothetical protein